MANKPLTGVNLGGWLVLEKWITPSLFDDTSAVDEYTYCKSANEAQLARLKQFRDTFINKKDFEWLASNGIEAVRLPIGYWVFGNAEPYMSTKSYVDKAFVWAQVTGLKVLLDVHGAPGSQNGKDHSGRIGETGWAQDPRNLSDTLGLIKKLADRYSNHPALLGISLLNEPDSNIPKALLIDYYASAYKIIRKACGKHAWIVYSDCYAPLSWRSVLPLPRFKGVYMDVHHYQVFSRSDKSLPAWLNLLKTRFLLPFNLVRFQREHPIIIGEWSLALCCSDLRKRTSDERRKISQKYARLQLRAFGSAAAWFFWTYKTEDSGLWSFRNCVESGLLVSVLSTCKNYGNRDAASSNN